MNKELNRELVEEVSKGNTEEVKLIAEDIYVNSDKINQHGKRAELMKSRKEDESYKPAIIILRGMVGGKVEITVSDKGNGIPDPIIDKIFQPFSPPSLPGRELAWVCPYLTTSSNHMVVGKK